MKIYQIVTPRKGIVKQQQFNCYDVTDMDDWSEMGLTDNENSNFNTKMQLSEIGDLFEISESDASVAQ